VSLVLPILLLFLVLVLFGRHLPGVVLVFFFVLAAPWLAVVLVVRLVQWVSGKGGVETEELGMLGSDPDVGDTTGSRTCRDPHCGKVNDGRARFCAQCGRPLL
jgi:hypothetical protein